MKLLGRVMNPAATMPHGLRGSAPGQVIIMFAVVAPIMIGMLGLAFDIGFTLLERRTVQNAADAGALAGARAVARYNDLTNRISAEPDVLVMAGQVAEGGVYHNAIGEPNMVTDCRYVDNSDAAVGTCGSNVPAAASGVAVTVEEEHDYFFLQVLGLANPVTVSASATAHVQRYVGRRPGDAPFILCGSSPWATETASGETPPEPNPNILDAAGKVRPEYVGWRFRVHDEKIGNNGEGEKADCGAKGASYNGLADPEANEDKDAPEWFDYVTGTRIGQVDSTVPGAAGCGPARTDGCVMFLPVASNPPEPRDGELWVTHLAAFRIERLEDGRHDALLLDSYIAAGEGHQDWSRESVGEVVVRLTG